ncbi:MAG: hypothetical protein MZU79_05885 [Anaerotruncus sp.]|nr:hypothetical protein [Anaerotruncus sp.]
MFTNVVPVLDAVPLHQILLALQPGDRHVEHVDIAFVQKLVRVVEDAVLRLSFAKAQMVVDVGEDRILLGDAFEAVVDERTLKRRRPHAFVLDERHRRIVVELDQVDHPAKVAPNFVAHRGSQFGEVAGLDQIRRRRRVRRKPSGRRRRSRHSRRRERSAAP